MVMFLKIKVSLKYNYLIRDCSKSKFHENTSQISQRKFMLRL